MQWHNYAREYIISQRDIKSGGWRDSTPRLLQVLVHSIYFSPRTLRSFSGMGLSIGVKVLRKTATLYSDVISSELIQEETLTESLIEEDQGRKVQVTVRSLFSVLYPHSCYKNASDCKIFLVVVDKKQKMHKVYEALLDLDYLLGPGNSYIITLTPVRSTNASIAYAPLSMTLDISRTSSVTQAHAAVLSLSIRSIYPTQEILSRFPKDFMVKLERLIDFSAVSKLDLFIKPEKHTLTNQNDANNAIRSTDIEQSHNLQLKSRVDSNALSTNILNVSAHAIPHDLDLTPASPYINATEINLSLQSNLPPSTPLSYTNLGANLLATSQHLSLRKSIPVGNTFQRSQMQPIIPKEDTINFTQFLAQNFIPEESIIYLSIVSAFKNKNLQKLLPIFGFAPTFIPQDNILSHTVSQYINFPLGINRVSYSIPICAAINDTPILMQQNSRMFLTQVDQHYNTILNLLMKMFPSIMILGDMNPLRLFPSLGYLNVTERSELVTERLNQRISSKDGEHETSDSNRSTISTENRQTMTLAEILDYVLTIFLDRISDLLIPVKGKVGSLHDIGMTDYNFSSCGNAGTFSSGSCPASLEAFKLLCEILDIRNNVFFQKTVVFVLFNSELEYPSLVASGLQSDDSIFYFPLPYSSNEQSHINIENIIRLLGLYLAFLHKAVHLTNLFSNCKTEENNFEQFTGFDDEIRGNTSTFEDDMIFNTPPSDKNQQSRESLRSFIGDDMESLTDGIKNQKLSLTSILLGLANGKGDIFQQDLLTHNKYQNQQPATRVPGSFSLQSILNKLGYHSGVPMFEDGRGIYISELDDINEYKIPAIASVMQNSLYMLLLTSPDDGYSSLIYKIFSSYNQSVLPYNVSDELAIYISDRSPLGSLLSKALRLLRTCASLANITLTTLHPVVIYPIPVCSAAHTEIFDEACKDDARAISLALVAQIVSCIGKGSISAILSIEDESYGKLFGTPAWLAILQCYCSGVLSWLRLFMMFMTNQQTSHNTTLLSTKGIQGTPTHGNNAISLTFGPLTMSTPIREHLTPTMSPGTASSSETVSQTDLASNITLRIIKTLELVINQAIRTYLRAQSVMPLVAMVVHTEVLPYKKMARAPLYLVYPSSKDRNNLQEISRLLLSEMSSKTPPTDVLQIDQKRNLVSNNYACNKPILFQQSNMEKDLLSSRNILVKQSVESKPPKGTHSKSKRPKTIVIKKYDTAICWESVSIGQYIQDSYAEASSFLDVQLQITIGGVPVKDNKKRKILSLKNLCILNTCRTINIASTNMFLSALKAYKYVYNYIYYRFIRKPDDQLPYIEYCLFPVEDDYSWYTTSSLNPENPTADWNGKPFRNRSLSTKRSSVRATEQGSLASNKAVSISTITNHNSTTKKNKQHESIIDLNTKQSKPQAIILSESSAMDDHREGSHIDSVSQNIRGYRSTYHDEKTQSEFQSCTSLSTSTTDINNIVGYTEPTVALETLPAQHIENIETNISGKHHLASTHVANMLPRTKSKRFNLHQSIRKSNNKSNRETRQRENSTINEENTHVGTNTCFIITHNPESPCQIPISYEYIQKRYLYTFIGVNSTATNIIVKPEASLQPYIRIPSINTKKDHKETLKYIPSELIKKSLPSNSSKALTDCNRHEIRITSKGPFIIQLNQLSAPIVTQSVSIKKSSSDIILIGSFNH